ncbi:unnamed protein product [Polarella glacialis]|uniref:Uncharacterized protein n=1 Tax=Polarella glacialis TaxID=89957 RepID=A0A813GKP9_POLGL|nr:unnamed protein product [Polarella glacialis]
MVDGPVIWEVVGGAEEGGILVREGRELTSAELAERLSVGALVEQLSLEGPQGAAERLHYRRLTGFGPISGWVSLKVKDKPLLTVKSKANEAKEGLSASGTSETSKGIDVGNGSDLLAKVSAALKVNADLDAANAAFGALAQAFDGEKKSLDSKLLLARGLLYWRWSRLDRALKDLTEAHRQKVEGAPQALLAMRLCLSQFPDAQILAIELGDTEAVNHIDRWAVAAQKMSNLFFPSLVNFEPRELEVLPGVLQRDVLIPTSEDAKLGVRLLLFRDSNGQIMTDRPLVLCFHGEDESVESFCRPEVFETWRAAGVSIAVASFRGYSFSTGTTSHGLLRVDGDAVCNELPRAFAGLGLPWPWPGQLALYGNSLGSRVACYLAGIRGELFDGGVVLETAWCGSYAPGARPLPEPPRHMALAAMGSNSMGDSRFGSQELNMAAGGLGRRARTLLANSGLVGTSAATAAAQCAHFCYPRGNEDLIRGFSGRLLILHGEVDHVVPCSAALRLCRGSNKATRACKGQAAGQPERQQGVPGGSHDFLPHRANRSAQNMKHTGLLQAWLFLRIRLCEMHRLVTLLGSCLDVNR